MKKKRILFFLTAFGVFALDWLVKWLVLSAAAKSNPIATSAFIDIVLVFNKGVAFSLGSFLGEWLKWLLLALLLGVTAAFLKSGEFFATHFLPLGVIIGAGFGNLLDRFTREGVVDYIFWHFGFNFAVFNLADAAINLAVAWLVFGYFFAHKTPKKAP